VFALDGDAIDATIRAFFLSFRHLPENQVLLSGSDHKLGPGYEGPGSTQNLRGNGVQIPISQQAQRNPITELGVHSSQPGLNYPRRVVLTESTHHLISEAEAFFYTPIGFSPVDPSIESANVFDSGDICREFPPDNLCKPPDYLRPSKR
jgi:hypothetical protein